MRQRRPPPRRIPLQRGAKHRVGAKADAGKTSTIHPCTRHREDPSEENAAVALGPVLPGKRLVRAAPIGPRNEHRGAWPLVARPQGDDGEARCSEPIPTSADPLVPHPSRHDGRRLHGVMECSPRHYGHVATGRSTNAGWVVRVAQPNA